MEDNTVSIKSSSTKKLIAALIAVVIVLSLSTIVAFAYGSQIIQLLGGGRIESGRTEDGGHYVSMTTSEEEPDPVEVRDGRVYFVLDGSNADITSYCTETTYFEYEYISDNGYHHVFIVGGAPDNLGWAEYILDADGNPFASNARYPDGSTHDEPPIWLDHANEVFGYKRLEMPQSQD